MFQCLTMVIFRLYMKYLLSSSTKRIWAVYMGREGGEVGTRSPQVPTPPNLYDIYEMSCPPPLLPTPCIQPI